MTPKQWAPFGLLLLLYVIRNDWWQWNDPRLVAGMPIGLTFHVGFMVVTAVAMFLLVRLAWPSHLESADDEQDPAEGDGS